MLDLLLPTRNQKQACSDTHAAVPSPEYLPLINGQCFRRRDFDAASHFLTSEDPPQAAGLWVRNGSQFPHCWFSRAQMRA